MFFRGQSQSQSRNKNTRPETLNYRPHTLNITSPSPFVASAFHYSPNSGIATNTGLQTLLSIRYRNARDTPRPATAPTRGTRPAESAQPDESSWEGGDETKRSFKVWLRSGFFSAGGSGAIWGRSGCGGSARRLEDRLRSRLRVFLRRS